LKWWSMTNTHGIHTNHPSLLWSSPIIS